MWKAVTLMATLGCMVTTVYTQQSIVFPAVANEVEGRNGSLWVTVARVIKDDP